MAAAMSFNKVEDGRLRSANFTPAEKNLLLDLIERYKSIIESRNLDAMTSKLKENTWIKLSNDYNSCLMPSGHRETKQLKKCYNNMKKAARKTASYYLTSDRKYGESGESDGGAMLTPIEARLMSMLDESGYSQFARSTDNNMSNVTSASIEYGQEMIDGVVIKMEDSDCSFTWQCTPPKNSTSLEPSSMNDCVPVQAAYAEPNVRTETIHMVNSERSGFLAPVQNCVVSYDEPLSSMSSTSRTTRSISESSIESITQPTRKNKSLAMIISNGSDDVLTTSVFADVTKRNKFKRKMEIIEIEHEAKMAVLEREKKIRETEIETRRVEFDIKKSEQEHRRCMRELELEGKRIDLDIKRAQLKLLEEKS